MNLSKCYICLANFKGIKSPISVGATGEESMTVLKKLQLVAPFQKWNENFLICHPCNDSLNATYEFLQLCCKFEGERLLLFQNNSLDKGNDYADLNVYIEIDAEKQSPASPLEVITLKIEPTEEADLTPEIDLNKIEVEEIKCFKCNRQFPDSNQLSIHIRNQHGFKCKLCPKDFRSKGSLGQHIRMEHPKKLLCEMCDKKFLSLKLFKEHCFKVHLMENSDIKPFVCEFCEKRFGNYTSYIRHSQYHMGIKHFTCKVCGKGFVTKKDLDMHEMIHDNQRNFCCKICGKCFNTLPNLRTHIKCVHCEKKFECYLCSKKFSVKSSLEEHIKRHMGLKEYSCLLCKASFAANCDLKRHMTLHTNERPFKCNLCQSKWYKHSRALSYHMKRHHNDNDS